MPSLGLGFADLSNIKPSSKVSETKTSVLNISVLSCNRLWEKLAMEHFNTSKKCALSAPDPPQAPSTFTATTDLKYFDQNRWNIPNYQVIKSGVAEMVHSDDPYGGLCYRRTYYAITDEGSIEPISDQEDQIDNFMRDAPTSGGEPSSFRTVVQKIFKSAGKLFVQLAHSSDCAIASGFWLAQDTFVTCAQSFRNLKSGWSDEHLIEKLKTSDHLSYVSTASFAKWYSKLSLLIRCKEMLY